MSSPCQDAVEKRERKRSSMRRSLGATFGDPSDDFSIPIPIRKISSEFETRCRRLEERIREFSRSSDDSVGAGPDRVDAYCNQRKDLAAEAGECYSTMLKATAEHYETLSPGPDRDSLEKAIRQFRENEHCLLRERAAHATRDAQLRLSMRGQHHSANMGEAYWVAVTEVMSEPAEASHQLKPGRFKTDQTNFRNSLIKAYTSPENGSKVLEEEALLDPIFQPSAKIWCPIFGMEFEPKDVKAAHIMPVAVGESAMAYMFGLPLGRGAEALWSNNNGLIMHNLAEKLFDDARMVIVPDPTDENEFISVILSQDLLRNKLCGANGQPFSSIHRKRLQFCTAARPGKRYLYMHTLLTLFRRKAHAVPGWEKDRELLLNGHIWATPAKWARKSMVQALAAEFGESWEELKSLKGLEEFPESRSVEEEKSLATEVRWAVKSNAK